MKNLLFLKKISKKINYSGILIIFFFCLFTLVAFSITNTGACFAAKNKKSLKAKIISQNKNRSFHKKKLQTHENNNTNKGLRKFHVTADTMISEKNAGIIEFSGNAVVNDGNSVIKADSIKIFLYTQKEQKQRKKEKKTGNIKKIIASGNVQYSSGNKKAFSDKAVYTTDNEVIVLTGKAPKVTMGNSFVTGKKIILFRKDGKVIVESGKKKRVEALFNSKDRNKK